MDFTKLKITIRNAWKNRVMSFAKLFGLSISFAVILFASSYVYYETSFDKNVPDHDRIYRCLMQGQINKEVADFAVTSPAEGPAIAAEVPEITESLRMLNRGEATLIYNNQIIEGGSLFYADPNFFSFWGIPVKTNMDNPLMSDNNLVIAQSIARKLFGSAENALGKPIKLRNENCIITGVFTDVPKNFHLQLKLIQPLQKSHPENVGWGSQNYYTYFKTNRSGIDNDALNLKISKVVYSHYDDEVDGAKAQNLNDLKNADNYYLFFTAEPLKNIHFSNHKFDPSITANKTYVYGAVILALLVLLISSVNFINLTVANISTRRKEVGIRKTNGAYRKHIILQFLYETLMFYIVSFTAAVFIYVIAGRLLAQSIGFDISIKESQVVKILFIAFTLLLAFILTVSIFPVSITSNKKIFNLIKGEISDKNRSWGNNGFILIQFVLSVLIIFCSVIVQKQTNFMVNKNRGYDSKNVLMLNLWQMSDHTRESFLEKLKTYSAIQSVSTSSIYFGNDFGMDGAHFETMEDNNYFHTSVLPADHDFMNTFDFKLKEGRFFEKGRKTDFEAALLNESALKEYKGEGSMVGKDIYISGRKYHVIGIVKDFNFRSLHYKIESLVITQIENAGNVYIKIKNNQIAEVNHILQKLWGEFNISFPLNYTFHDAVLANNYSKDQQAKKLLLLLSIISIVIASVGLYAVSFFTIVRKTKEIGIRKVNGARISEIFTLLNTAFVKWVIIAFLIAFPIAWYVMDSWLENFAFKTEINWWIFVLTGILVTGIALLTVSWQSWRAARRNPVEALRYE